MTEQQRSILSQIKASLTEEVPGLKIDLRNVVDPEDGSESIVLCATNLPVAREAVRGAFSKVLSGFYYEIRSQGLNVGTMIEVA